MKQSIAQRTARKQRRKGHPILGLLASTPFAVIGYYCKYVLPGYSFTFLVCAGIIALILFYSYIPIVGQSLPTLARWATWLVTTGLVLGLALFAVTEFFIVRAALQKPDPNIRYMVVLGAKVRPDGPSVSLQDRIDKAYEYLTEHPNVTAIVSGGQGDDEVISEADCMYLELVRKGIDPSRIWKEDRASSTDENMRFSLELIQQKTGTRPKTLGILSSEYHLFRASLMAKKLGIGFSGIPARTSRISQLINHGMREVAGVWHFFIFGR